MHERRAKLQGARYFAINRSVISSTTRHESKMQRAIWSATVYVFPVAGKVEKVCEVFLLLDAAENMGQPRHVPFYGFILDGELCCVRDFALFNEEKGFMN